jgi:hypothetical protein
MRLRRTAAAFALILGITVSVVAFARMAEDRKANQLIQEGRNAELVNDLPGAIERYLLAVKEAEAGNNRELAAKALLQLGMAYQKKGEARAAATFDRIVREYGDQPSAAEARKRAIAIRGSNSAKPADAGYTDVPELRSRTIWQDEKTDTTGRVSPDGRYLSFVDRSAGDALAVRDLVSRSNRTLAKPGSGTVGASAISRDGRRIAYAWHPRELANAELRVVGVDGLQDRSVYSNAAVSDLRPTDWTPAGEIVALLSTKDGASRIETIALNGKTSNLKRFAGPEKPGNMTVSPDGHFIAYDAPQPADPGRRDIFTLSVEGGFVEYSVVQHGAANDTVLGWVADSKLLFASDRDGTAGVWAIDVSNGKASAAPPIRVQEGIGGIRSLGVTRGGSLLYGIGESQVSVLENVVPELSRLQLAALQRPGQTAIPILGVIEGIVVKRGTNEPISGADVELARLEGTASFPLNPGAAEAFANLPPVVRPPELPPALAPEVQYASTGDSGRFVFRNLKPGGYRLVAKEGSGLYYTAQYGQRDPRGAGFLLPLGDGESFRDAKLEMAPLSLITGRVFDAEGRPLGHARVDLVYPPIYRDGRPVLVKRSVHTNERGDYRLSGLPPGRYTVAASYQEKSEMFITVTLPGTQEGASPIVTRRILPSGDIIEETFGVVYYGDVLDPSQARYIELGLGLSSFAGADIHLSAGRRRSHHIRGVLINGVTGQPAAGIQVRAVARQQAPTAMISFDVTDSQGAFDLFGIVAGDYDVFSLPFAASAGQRGRAVTEPQLRGYAAVAVGNSDVDNLRIVAVAPLNLEGHASIEGRVPSEAGPDLEKMRIVLMRHLAIVGTLRGTADEITLASVLASQAGRQPPDVGIAVRNDGSFVLPVLPGDFRVGVTGIPPNAFVKSIRMGAVDILTEGIRGGAASNGPLEIVVDEKSGELPGIAVNAGGAAMPNVVVALVPDSLLLKQRSDLYRSATTDIRGRFKMQAVPPGSYKVFAWEYVDPGIWHDAEFMRAYEASGKLVRVTEGRNPEVQVTVTPVQKSR